MRFFIKKVNYLFLTIIVFFVAFFSLSNNFLYNTSSSFIKPSSNDFIITGDPQIINTSYEYDYTTGTGKLEAYYFVGYDQFGIINLPSNLGITTDPNTPSSDEHVQWNDIDEILDETYTTSDDWNIGSSSEIVSHTPDYIYYSSVELVNFPEDFNWDEHYVILETVSRSGPSYSKYDVTPMNFSVIAPPESGSTTIMDTDTSTVTMQSKIYAGKDLNNDPWAIDETTIAFRDYDSVEILNSSIKENYLTLEYRISDLTPETFYKISSFTIDFTETSYSGKTMTVSQLIPSFTTEGDSVIVPPPPDNSTSNSAIIYISIIGLILLSLIIILVIASLFYIRQRKKRIS